MRPSVIVALGFEERETPAPPPRFSLDIRWANEVRATVAADYSIKGIIEQGSTSIWFGPPGTYKTFLLLSAQMAVASGREFFGHKVRQGRTLYLALEGRGGIDRRVRALIERFGPCTDFGVADERLALLTADGARAARANGPHVEALRKAITENEIRFVVIDTINLALGGSDENDNGVMGLLIGLANELAQSTGCHIAFIAHSAKSGTLSGPRGGGAQKGNSDLVVAINLEDGVAKASSYAPDGKSKDGEPFAISFKLERVELGRDADGDVISSCIVVPAEPEDAQAPRLRGQAAVALRELQNLTLDAGEPLPAGRRFPSDRTIRGVREDQWEKYCETASITSSNKPDAKRVAFARAARSLQRIGLIGVMDGWVWLTNKSNKPEQGRTDDAPLL